MTVEQRLEQLERKTNRLRIAVVVLAAALCGVVSMAATERTESVLGKFDTVAAQRVLTKQIFVQNEKGDYIVLLGADDDGNGLVSTFSQTDVVEGRALVRLFATSNGGAIAVRNKTGETIVTLAADEYGNGEVGAWNRKGKGRVYTSQ